MMQKSKMRELLEPDMPALQEYLIQYANTNKDVAVEDFLRDYWAANNKLFKLLGNKLQAAIPFELEQTQDCLYREFLSLVGYDTVDDGEFYLGETTNEFCWEYLQQVKKLNLDHEYALLCVLDPRILAADFCEFRPKTIEFTMPGAKHSFRCNSGVKPIRFLTKFINYVGKENFPHFEEFRLAHSRIFNTKHIKGELVLSIHPLDFITMSDNANNWQSCMNWRSKGCYRVGTQEMMNSNNVIIAYIKSQTETLKFGGFTWNSKKWRQLVYVTKPIIVTGKSYPYEYDDLSRLILTYLKDLAAKNLKWNYEYDQPEEYTDMAGIHTLEDMLEFHTDSGDENDTRIIFNSHGMYNDMMKDHNRTYWCIRNRVYKPKKICYSGKARCLECGKIRELCAADEDDIYVNDHFEESFLCKECNEKYTCDECNNFTKDKDATIFPKIVTRDSPYNSQKNARLCSRCVSSVYWCGCCDNWALDPYIVWDKEVLDAWTAELSKCGKIRTISNALNAAFHPKAEEEDKKNLIEHEAMVLCNVCRTKYCKLEEYNGNNWWDSVYCHVLTHDAIENGLPKEKILYSDLKKYSKKV